MVDIDRALFVRLVPHGLFERAPGVPTWGRDSIQLAPMVVPRPIERELQAEPCPTRVEIRI